MTTFQSTFLPYSPVTPSAPPIVELPDYSPLSASCDDLLYYDYDPYAEGRDEGKHSADNGVIRMYEVNLNDRPRLPPPLPARPSWSPSRTVREQSNSSSASVERGAPHNSPSMSLSMSTSFAPFRYVHSSEPNRPLTVLDTQQLHARTLTTRAEPLWFRIHNTVLRLHPVSFDDLPEMTLWLNRAKFSSNRVIHDTHGRVLCSLRWLMSEAGQERFVGMQDVLKKSIRMRQEGAVQGTDSNMEYFFYGDHVGILYTERRLCGEKLTWGDSSARVDTCCVIS